MQHRLYTDIITIINDYAELEMSRHIKKLCPDLNFEKYIIRFIYTATYIN